MKGTGKPKEFLHKATGGILNFFQEGINVGKRVARTTADSVDGRRLSSAKGSIFAEDEGRIKQEIAEQSEKTPPSGCGLRECNRRLKQIQQHSIK